MACRVAVLQSNYIPWRGYFDLINDDDVFIFYDDVQYTTRDWRNRNYVKTARGRELLTIPVGSRRDRKICEVAPTGSCWQLHHWKTICHNYARAPYFAQFKDFFDEFFLKRVWTNLSELNRYLIEHISVNLLGASTQFIDSRSFELSGARTERILMLLEKAGATHYLSGPAARSYIDANAFRDAGIGLQFKDYSGYPSYPQFHPPFISEVSVLDLLFQTGASAPDYIWGWRNRTGAIHTGRVSTASEGDHES